MPKIDNQRLTEFWSIMNEYNRLAHGEFMEIYRKYQGDEAGLIRALQLYMPEIASQYRALAAETGMLFYEDQDFLIDEQLLAQAGAVNSKALAAQIESTIKDPNITDNVAFLGGLLQRVVTQGARSYGLDAMSVKEDRWWRACRPDTKCSFCKMLATRAQANWRPYKSYESAGGSGFKFHPNCYCVPVKATHYDVPDYVKKWEKEYYTAVDDVGNSFNTQEILNVMDKIGRGTFKPQG